MDNPNREVSLFFLVFIPCSWHQGQLPTAVPVLWLSRLNLHKYNVAFLLVHIVLPIPTLGEPEQSWNKQLTGYGSLKTWPWNIKFYKKLLLNSVPVLSQGTLCRYHSAVQFYSLWMETGMKIHHDFPSYTSVIKPEVPNFYAMLFSHERFLITT